MITFQHDGVAIRHSGDFDGYAEIEYNGVTIAVPCKALAAFGRAATLEDVFAAIEDRFRNTANVGALPDQARATADE